MANDSRDDGESAADGPLTVPDEDLPEDLQPTGDNPLAQPAGDDVPEDVLTQDAGHAASGGDPEGARGPGNGEAEDDTSAASSGEAPSGPSSTS